MRIVYLTDKVYLHGGAERILTNKLNFLAKRKYELYLITFEEKNNPSCYEINPSVQQSDLSVNYDRTRSFYSPVNLFKAIQHYHKLNKSLQNIQPDIVITISPALDNLFLPLIYRKAFKIREFHSSHGLLNQSVQSNVAKLRNKLTNYCDAKYDQLVILNKDELPFYPSVKITVIQNFIEENSNDLAPLVNKLAICAGRIAPVKGFEKLIEAWSIVILQYPDWQLHIYGEDYPDTQNKLEKQVSELKLGNSVSFKGVSQDMTSTMQDYSMYLMSSQTECFPMVLLEAMSCGIPCISFDCPTGPRNIITNGEDGILVEPGNVVELAMQINYLIEHPEVRVMMGQTARKNSARFSPETIMGQWQSLFKKLMNKPLC